MAATQDTSPGASNISEIGLVSADSHVNEPHDLWSSNLPPSLRAQAMRGIESGEDGSWNVVFNGQHVFKRDMASEEERLAVLDPAKRFDVLRSEGIVAECIFPTIGLYVWMLEDPEGGQRQLSRLQRVDTRHAAEQVGSLLLRRDHPRMGTRPARRRKSSESRNSAYGRSCCRRTPRCSWNHRVWDPMWDAIDATGLPVVMHQGTGFDTIWYRGPGATVANLIATETIGPRVATLLATSGVLERHPNLHVVFVEFNTGWLAWVEELMDYYDRVFREYDDIHKDRRAKPTVYPDLRTLRAGTYNGSVMPPSRSTPSACATCRTQDTCR